MQFELRIAGTQDEMNAIMRKIEKGSTDPIAVSAGPILTEETPYGIITAQTPATGDQELNRAMATHDPAPEPMKSGASIYTWLKAQDKLDNSVPFTPEQRKQIIAELASIIGAESFNNRCASHTLANELVMAVEKNHPRQVVPANVVQGMEHGPEAGPVQAQFQQPEAVPTSQVQPVSQSVPGATAGASSVTKDQVLQAMKDNVARLGNTDDARNRVKGVLSQFGATNLTTVPGTQYGAFIQALNAL